MNVHIVDTKSLHLGDNLYQAGSLALPAQTRYKAGMLLRRDGAGFALAADTDTVIAVLGFDVENPAETAGVKTVSGIIWGRVRQDMLFYHASPATGVTAAQCDALRGYGIVAQAVSDLSQLDNH